MRSYLYLTAAVGAIGVMAGAFGAHALKDTLITHGTTSTWNTAVLYHLIHAPALLAVCFQALDKNAATSWLNKACAAWITGVVLFSGSLYWLSLGGPRWLGPVTPLGGLFLILGWLCVAVAAAKHPKTS
ncbi:DUF423 domain-containing protein [Rariglobus hedericola]|uniref:DUF423 domain-containing protein n=1 Tax=Rariglobus hedericola TaxID=2597822 RepID=A0A556QS12_9BACT|nr:DUF423 domain-containing protein [Rariglobus hedericola]TSJ79413.1 DUF423 domain-containing protein [Rariglobus hedericola]